MIDLKGLMDYAKEHPGGFTIDHDGYPIDEGFAIAMKSTKHGFGPVGAAMVLETVKFNPVFMIGGWKESHDTIMWFDAILITHDYDLAVAWAIKQEQKAFFDLTNNILCTFKNK